MKWHIGCSGFMYRDWKGIFYPEGLAQKNWLSYYATHFNTLEINSSFYKFPTPASLQKMYEQVPADFLFSLKAPRVITHYRQLKDCKTQADEFYTAISNGLKEKFGAALFQFPPKFSYTEERLNLLIEMLNPHFRNVVEFRNESWFNEGVKKILAENNIIFSGLSHPTLPHLQQPIQNTPSIYYRFHGIPKLFYSEYSPEQLQDTLGEILKTAATDAFIYFNNTASDAGLKNATALIKMLDDGAAHEGLLIP